MLPFWRQPRNPAPVGGEALGPSGEGRAAAFLQQRGCRIIGKNYRCRYAEIDLIVEHRGVLAFVEVKARRSQRCGSGMEAVSRAKQRRIIRAALMYVQDRGGQERMMRFDVIAVDAEESPPRITWLQDAFRADFLF